MQRNGGLAVTLLSIMCMGNDDTIVRRCVAAKARGNKKKYLGDFVICVMASCFSLLYCSLWALWMLRCLGYKSDPEQM